MPGLTDSLSNRDLILPYFLPYFAYVGIASVPDNIISIEINYFLRIFIVAGLIVWARQWFFPLSFSGTRIKSIVWGVAAGLAGFVIWSLLLFPFLDSPQGEPWSIQGFLLRIFAAGLLVPVFEELAIRGYVLRLALQWDRARKNKEKDALLKALDEASVFDVKRGDWTWPAVLISSLAFTLGHTVVEWAAAFCYSLLISWVWVKRGDLLSCMVAHGTTNIVLALFVFMTGMWGFW
ncbi:MAG: CPBP family glutamic-type intramembrane protease [Desulfobacteraceae bacterium]